MAKKQRNQKSDWREIRRFRAWELHEKGWKQVTIAEALGVTAGAVSQWLKRAREGGVEALRTRKVPGARPKLTPKQRSQIPELLRWGAEAFGFRGDIWTCGRVDKVIQSEFGVSYHPAHISRLLRDIGWSLQKPVRRASQRDEEAIERWEQERWPELKKLATLHFVTINWNQAN
jgi:transposase